MKIKIVVGFLLVILPLVEVNNYFQAPDLGLYLTKDNEVYQYEGYIYIPYTLSLPIEQIEEVLTHFQNRKYKTVEAVFNEDCPIYDTLLKYKDNALDYLTNVIPDADIITPEYSSMTEVLHKKNYNTSLILHENQIRTSLTIKNPSNLKRRLTILNKALKKKKEDKTNKLADIHNTKLIKRVKRFEPITMSVIGIGLLIGAGFIWNRVDIQSLKSETEMIKMRLDTITEKLDESIIGINKLSENLDWVYIAITDINKDLQNITGTLNCHITITDILLTKLSSWMYVTVQSFIRALNSGLIGNINLDLLSGQNVHKLIKSHVNLRDTIYTTRPNLLYKIGKFELLEVRKPPYPSITGLLILPNIKLASLGNIYKSYTCPFVTKNNVFSRLDLPENILYEKEEDDWMEISMAECAQSTTMVICPLHAISGRYNKCVEGIYHQDINSTIEYCKKCLVDSSYNGLVITTSLGIIACPTNGTVNVIWSTPSNVEKTKQMDLKAKSKLFTSNDAVKILYNNNIYLVKDSAYFNITSMTIGTVDFNISSTDIKDLDIPWNKVPYIHPVPIYNHIISYHDIILYSIITILVIVIIGLIIIWQRRDKTYKTGLTLFSKYYQRERVNNQEEDHNDNKD